MNHYEILGITTDASHADVKKAYRKMVKVYHPDVNPSISAVERMIHINEAYEILSEPTSRNLYDLFLQGIPVKTDIEESTPYQRYREEYRAKRVKKEREKIVYLVRLKTRFYRFERVANMVFFLIGIMLTVDYYYQPKQEIESIKEIVYQRYATKLITTKGTQITTSNQFFHDVKGQKGGQVLIKYSEFTGLPVRVQSETGSNEYIVNGSIYTFRNVFSIIILIFSAVVVKNKEYSDFRLSCGLVPGFFVLFMMLLILSET